MRVQSNNDYHKFAILLYFVAIKNLQLNLHCKVLQVYLLFVKRKLAKAFCLPNLDAAGIGGPNGGTSFDLLTATLKKIYSSTYLV